MNILKMTVKWDTLSARIAHIYYVFIYVYIMTYHTTIVTTYNTIICNIDEIYTSYITY